MSPKFVAQIDRSNTLYFLCARRLHDLLNRRITPALFACTYFLERIMHLQYTVY